MTIFFKEPDKPVEGEIAMTDRVLQTRPPNLATLVNSTASERAKSHPKD